MSEEWNGFEKVTFEFEGQTATVVLPHRADARGRFLLKTEYFGAFPAFELEMLSRGWHLVNVKNSTRWCRESDTERQAALVRHVSNKYGLSAKCVPVGMSCGGMQAIYLAAKHPELVSCLYLDAPVVDLLSVPAGLGRAGDSMWREFESAFGVTKAELLSYRKHPLDYLGALVAHKIPVFLVAGDSDSTVPFEENGALVRMAYEGSGVPYREVIKAGCDHHPHGLEDNAELVAFVEKYSV